MAKEKTRPSKKEREHAEEVNSNRGKMMEDEMSQESSRLAAMSGTQRAAAVVVSLGVEKASQIYKYMEPEEVESLTLEVARLGYLDSQVTEELLSDMMTLLRDYAESRAAEGYEAGYQQALLDARAVAEHSVVG